MSIVRLNVGGTLFTTTLDTLQKEHDSMLARMFGGALTSRQDDTGAYFIDRDGTHFATILNYLRDGQCILPRDLVARQELLHEARFYGLEGLVASLLPPAASLYASTMDRLLSTPQHKRATTMLWEVAFTEPLQPSHLAGSWVRLTASPARVMLKGPTSEKVFEQDKDKDFQAALLDVKYLHEVASTLLPLHFAALGFTCRLSTPVGAWQDALTSWGLLLDWDRRSWPSLYHHHHDGDAAIAK